MKSKIFKVVGILLGSVLAFVGVVVGVMAIRGDFKRESIYPTQLVFEENNFEVVNDYSSSLKSFTLTGTAPKKKEVNKKTCYLNFVNNEGVDLITLCDSNGVELQRENDLSYKIKCNEPIYYRLKEVDRNQYLNADNKLKENYGRVVLEARDERNLLTPARLTFWVDMSVERVKIANLELKQEDRDFYQQTALALGAPFYFNFETNPDYAFYPISSKESSKNVEVYFIDESVMTNFVRVDGNFLEDYINSLGSNPSKQSEKAVLQNLKTMLSTVEHTNESSVFNTAEDVLMFRTSNQTTDAGRYHFRIAMFDSYTAQKNDEDNPSPQETNLQRTNRMVHTDLYITVDNYDVEEVRLSAPNVTLHLYSDFNYITLNGTPADLAAESINNNDLGLTMISKQEVTTDRLNEVNFGIENVGNWLEGDEVLFISKNSNLEQSITLKNGFASLSGFDIPNDNYSIEGNILTIGSAQFAIEKDSIKINGKELIKSISYENTTLESARGAVFIEDGEFKILSTGSYLEFYNLNDGKFELCENFYDVTPSGTLNTRTFKVVPKEIVDNLYLLILVVNSNGSYHYAYVQTSIIEQPSRVEYKNTNRHYEVNVTYPSATTALYGEKRLEDIVTITGSYNAGVLVTPLSAEYSVDVIENIKYQFGVQTYVLVGYFNGINFVNAVRAKDYGISSSTSLYLLQLKNAYQQTSAGFIRNIITAEGVVCTFQYTDGEGATIELSATLSQDEFGEMQVTIDGYDARIIQNELHVNKDGQDYVCTFKSLAFGGQDILLNGEYEFNAKTASDINTAEEIVVKNNYAFVTENLNFEFNACQEYEDATGTDEYCKKVDSDYHYLEKTTHKITISSSYSLMLKNLINDITANNFEILIKTETGYIPTDALKIGDADDNGDADKIERNEDSLTLPVYAKEHIEEAIIIRLTINGISVTLPKIYIDSNKATDISLLVEGDEYDLQSSNTQVGSNVLTIEIGYNEGSKEYEYVYYINETEIGNVTELFNSTYTSETSFGFKAKPGYKGVTYNLAYDSTNSNYLKFQDGELQVLNVTSRLGDVFIRVVCDDVTKYLPVKIVANGFDFSLKSDASHELDNDTYLSSLINYKYQDSIISRADYISLEIVECNNKTYTTQTTETGIELGYRGDDAWVAVVSFEKTNDGWLIKRSTKFAHTNLTITFNASVLTSPSKLTLTINFTDNITITLNSEYQNFYANTKIMFAEKATTEDGFTHKPMFKILDKSGTTDNVYTIKYTYITLNQNGEIGTLEPFTLSEGEYNFQFFKVGIDEVLIEFRVVVSANIVVSQTEQQKSDAQTLTSDSEEVEISKILTLQAYSGSIVFGDSASGALTYQSDGVLVDFADYSNLKLDTQSLALDYTSGNTNFNTKHIEEIYNYISKTITLSYGNFSTSIPVKVSNKYTAEVNSQNIEIRANIWYDCPIEIVAISGEDIAGEYWALSGVRLEGEDLKFEHQGNQFKLAENIVEDHQDVNIIFEFSYLGNKLTFKAINGTRNLSVTLKPHVPPQLKHYVAYSNNEFDLIREVFNLDEDDSVQEMKIQAIDPADANAFSDTSFVNARGYIKGDLDNTGCKVKLNDIVGQTRTVRLTYSISYVSGGSYLYKFNLVITNCQSMAVNYPYDDYSTDYSSVNFRLVDNASSQDEEYFNNQTTTNSKFKFEPVETGQQITFAYDDNLHFNRVETQNLGKDTTRQPDVSKVELIAYEEGMPAEDLNKIYTITDKSITFKNGATFTTVYLVFKVTSNSGNYVYYYVHLSNTTYVNKSINANSNWKIGEIESKNTPSFYQNNSVLGVKITDDVLKKNFNVSNINLNNLKIYTLDATMLDGSNFFKTYNVQRFHQPSGQLNAINNFCTLIFALLYQEQEGFATLLLGTIVADIQPNVSIQTSLQNYNSGVSNGVYTFEASGLNLNENFNNPFSISNASLQEVTIIPINNSAFSTDGESLFYNGTSVLAVQSSSIVIKKYTSEPIEVPVKYQFKIAENNFVLYLILKLNSPSILSNHDKLNAGTFNGIKEFETKIVFNQNEQSIIPNSYKGKVKFEIDGTDYGTISTVGNASLSLGEVGNCTTENGLLTIDFNLTGKTYHFKIIFVDILPEKQILFDVEASNGLHTEFLDGKNGKAEGTAYETELTYNYNSEYGSSMPVTFDGNNISLGGLDIYSKYAPTLTLIPSSEQDAKFIASSIKDISHTTTIQFYHLASDKIIPFTLDIQANGVSLLKGRTLTFYIKLNHTYKGIKAVYPLVNAQYENVASNSTIEDIRANLFETINNETLNDLSNTDQNLFNKKRIALIDRSSSLVFDYNIGFSNSSTPNYINIIPHDDVNDVLDNGKIKLEFQPIKNNNSIASITLSNASGMQAITYNYQIIGEYDKIGGGTDGLQVLNGSQANLQTNLISNIAVADTAWDKTFSATNTIANLIDGNNNQIYLTNLKANLDGEDVQINSVLKATQGSNIVYTIELEHITLTLTRQQQSSGKTLVLGYSRVPAQEFDKYKNLAISLTLYGESGLMADLKININNA